MASETVGQRLRRLRLERNLSQRELSSPGVSYAYISRVEAGARTPSVRAIRKLAAKLGVSAEYLESGETSPVEQACLDVGLDFGSLDAGERVRIFGEANSAAYEAAAHVASDIAHERAQAEAARLRAEADRLEKGGTA